MEIRYCLPDDDRMAISKVYEESWKYAYKNIIPQEYLNSIHEGYWAPAIDAPNRKTMICIDGGRIVGTSSFGNSRFENLPDWGEIISIYLLPDYIGVGYGKLLMTSVLSELKRDGYKDIFLWVLEENIRARHFYEQFGFSPSDDFLNDNIGGRALREVRYIYRMR